MITMQIQLPEGELDKNGAPKITQFIDRRGALAANPRLADIKLGPQPIVRKPSL
jgi:hypothetical protein